MADRYTEADRAAVKQALMDLMLGKRVQSVAIAGRTITYAGGVTKSDLEGKLADIEAYLDAQAGRPRQHAWRVITSKGL